MFKKVFLLLLFLSYSVYAEPTATLNSESIDEFYLGQSGQDLQKKLRCHLKKQEDQLWEADGEYHQTWDCYESGISFDMVSQKKGNAKIVASIMVITPNQAKTKRGIHVGSPEQEVERLYAKEKDLEASHPHETFVAGSVYGGLTFQFKNGVVESMFLGSGAE